MSADIEEEIGPLSVLLIDDDPNTARLITKTLDSCSMVQIKLACTRDFECARNCDFHLLLFSLKGSDALEPVRRVVAEMPERPVVVLSDVDDDAFAFRVVQAGAQECLFKGRLEARLLVSTLRHAAERQRKLNELTTAWQHERYLATHDALTGLPNRQALFDRLSVALAHAARDNLQLAVFFLDLDRFKWVNDQFGHTIGDDVLRSVAERLARCIRKSDTVARFGGDEFTIILSRITGDRHIAMMAEKILAAVSEHFALTNEEIVVRASIGISVYPQDGNSPNDLVERADQAMYASKQARSQARYCFFAEVRGLSGSRRRCSLPPKGV